MPDSFLHSDITYKVRGCCFAVMNELGCGHKEIVYHKALEQEFFDQKLQFVSEPRLKVFYKSKKVGFYKPDFVIEKKVIVELKSVEFLPKKSFSQFRNYLRGTNFEVGLLVNFGQPNIQIFREVWFKKLT